MTNDNETSQFAAIGTTAQFENVGTETGEIAAIGLSASDKAAVQALPPTSALLIVHHGPNAGARFLLDAERVTAGRDTKADIFLDDVTVSRKHAEFNFDGQHFTVRDVGSLNGTYVNRDRIDLIQLQPGDEVQIGKYRLIFYPSPQRPAADSVPPAAEQQDSDANEVSQ